MHPRRRLGLLVAAGVLAGAPAARAYHDDEHELVADTAYTLGARQTQLGLWRLDYGLRDWLDVGTYHWLWIVPFPNVQGKVRVWHSGRWAFAVRTGLYYVHLDFVPWADRDSDASIAIFPFELYFSLPIAERWGVSVVSASTGVYVQGRYDPSEFRGAGAFDNQQFGLSGEWRATRVLKFVLALRWLVAERVRGDATVTRQLDDFTTLEIAGAAELQAKSVRDAAYTMLSAVLSWKRFNLRVGLGVGNYNIPALNLMLPEQGLVGELDLYWRF